jgi:hypothetical protein
MSLSGGIVQPMSSLKNLYRASNCLIYYNDNEYNILVIVVHRSNSNTFLPRSAKKFSTIPIIEVHQKSGFSSKKKLKDTLMYTVSTYSENSNVPSARELGLNRAYSQ